MLNWNIRCLGPHVPEFFVYHKFSMETLFNVFWAWAGWPAYRDSASLQWYHAGLSRVLRSITTSKHISRSQNKKSTKTCLCFFAHAQPSPKSEITILDIQLQFSLYHITFLLLRYQIITLSLLKFIYSEMADEILFWIT